jgi:hypothetical protein
MAVTPGACGSRRIHSRCRASAIERSRCNSWSASTGAWAVSQARCFVCACRRPSGGSSGRTEENIPVRKGCGNRATRLAATSSSTPKSTARTAKSSHTRPANGLSYVLDRLNGQFLIMTGGGPGINGRGRALTGAVPFERDQREHRCIRVDSIKNGNSAQVWGECTLL